MDKSIEELEKELAAFKDMLENYIIQDMMCGIKSEKTVASVELIRQYVKRKENEKENS